MRTRWTGFSRSSSLVGSHLELARRNGHEADPGPLVDEDAPLGRFDLDFDPQAGQDFPSKAPRFLVWRIGQLAADILQFRHLLGPVPQQPQDRPPRAHRGPAAAAACAAADVRRACRRTDRRQSTGLRPGSAAPDRDGSPQSRPPAFRRKNASQYGRDRRKRQQGHLAPPAFRRPRRQLLGQSFAGRVLGGQVFLKAQVQETATPAPSPAMARMPVSSRIRSRNPSPSLPRPELGATSARPLAASAASSANGAAVRSCSWCIHHATRASTAWAASAS